MEFSLTEEQAALLETYERFFGRECSPARVRAAEPLGLDAELWKRLCATDVLTMALPPEAGGAGAGLVELTLACEAQGRAAAPVPLVEAAVATRLLARLAKGEIAARCATGNSLATLAVQPGVSGHCTAVPAGAVADVVVGLDRDELVACGPPPAGPPGGPATLGSAPVADRSLRGDGAGPRQVLAHGPSAAAEFDLAVSEWMVLTAAALVGVGHGALGLGVGYARERRQFGVPIGSFQSIAHRLADAATGIEGARLLARHAAWMADRGLDPAGGLARMAFGFAAEAAQEAASVALHIHGGYGFILEYDVQLYYRRAKAWALVAGDPTRLQRSVGELIAAGRYEPAAFAARVGPSSAAFRREAQAFVVEHVTPDTAERAHRSGTMHDWDLHRALAHRGWLTASWPVELGGQGRHPADVMALLDELARVEAPFDGWVTTMSACGALIAKGSEEQRRTVLPAVAAGEAIIALGFSEPESGSDVAAAATRAVRDGDGWVINGQKMFTSLAHEARWVLLLTRTNADVAKHRGLTVFLVPLDSAGIEIQPVRTLGGERTNITFYTDVRVGDDARVGAVDGGWEVVLAALAFERGSAFGAIPSFLGTARLVLEEAADWVRRTTDGPANLLDDPLVQVRLGRAATAYEVARLLGYRSLDAAANGGIPDVEAAQAKLFAAESLQAICSDLLDMLGQDGLIAWGEPGAPGGGLFEHAFRHAPVTTIYGGTSEIMRTIVADRGLRLPRG